MLIISSIERSTDPNEEHARFRDQWERRKLRKEVEEIKGELDATCEMVRGKKTQCLLERDKKLIEAQDDIMAAFKDCRNHLK